MASQTPSGRKRSSIGFLLAGDQAPAAAEADAPEPGFLQAVGRKSRLHGEVRIRTDSFSESTRRRSPCDATEPVTAGFARARLEVRSYADFPDDWDGSDGIPPSQRAIDESMHLLSQLERLQVVEPKTMLDNDGEIGLYWRTDRCYLEIGVMGDGDWGAYGNHRNLQLELMIDDHSIDKTFPEHFVEFLEKAGLLRDA